ncbi:MAG: CPBP family glutamic-type intramembrane protease, partial [Planctomycetota bacterium]
SAAFGLVHALNPTGPFVGRWEFAPWHGLATGSSLLYGLLRARTGGILAPALLHATVDVAGEFVRAGA